LKSTSNNSKFKKTIDTILQINPPQLINYANDKKVIRFLCYPNIQHASGQIPIKQASELLQQNSTSID